MCEVLFWKAAYPLTGDNGVDCHRPVIGAGIVSCPDGWGWTPTELTDPRWRIVAVPGLAASVGQAFCAAAPNYGNAAFPHARRFGFSINTAKIPPAALTWWNDDTRAQPIFTLNVSATQLANFKQANSTLT